MPACPVCGQFFGHIDVLHYKDTYDIRSKVDKENKELYKRYDEETIAKEDICQIEQKEILIVLKR